MKNKVAIVTGAASGLGKAIAKRFVENGTKVVVSDIDETKGKKVVEELNKNDGDTFFIKADISKPEDCKMLVEKTVEKFGKIDFAVNNAGIGGEQSVTGEYSVDNFKKVIDINLNGVFYGMHFQLPEILKQKGVIINMASILGSVGTPYSAAYVAAKHGVVGLTKTTALEYAKKGVRVNSVGPGYIETPLLDQLDEEQKKQLVQAHPIGRLGKPAEVANLVVWLCSEEASFITGSYYLVDGGYTAQ